MRRSATLPSPLLPRAKRAVGRGRGWGVAQRVPAGSEFAETPPTPDPSPPLRGGRGEDRTRASVEQTGRSGLNQGHPGLAESPQRDFAPANYGTSATIPTLDPELAKQLGFTTEEEDAAAMARPARNRMEALGVAATADALETLIREGRPEFRGEDGQLKIWTPHRPPRPEKSEGGVRFVIKSDYEPKGDQPTAIAELVEGIGRNDRTQVLLGVTGSGKTYTMAKVIEATQRPALILAPNKTLAAQLYGEFKSFFPDNAVEYFVSYYDYYQPEAYVPRTDTYIEKDSSINEQIDRMRHSATRALLGARRRHHRGVRVVHLRYRLGRDLYRDDLCAEEGRAHRPAATDRRPRGAAIQAHAGRFFPRHFSRSRRRHRHLPGALRGPRLAREPVRRHR